MNILYLVNFNLNEKGGLGLITKHKVDGLRELVDNIDTLHSPFSNSYLKVLYGFILDLKGLFYVLYKKPDFVISRGPLGLFTIFFAKRLGIKTVREVHSYALEEIKLLRYKGLNLLFLKFMAHYSHYLDLRVDLRIFNHPDLLKYYRSKGYAVESDFFTYNGYSIDNLSALSKKDALNKFGLSTETKYLVFVGSATKWHGVEYLVDLQREFLKNSDPIQIVCGGASIADFDCNGVCLNISPLDSVSCGHLIKAGDLCLLPVKNNRISPGSPLKLYDYIINSGVVVAQENMLGYSDEVKKYGIGFCVDFSNAKSTRESIVNYLFSCSDIIEYPLPPVSWQDRMKEWVHGMNKINQ